MDIIGILKDAFVYPTKNMGVFGLIGCLAILFNLLSGLKYIPLSSEAYIVISLVLIVFYILGIFILPGYFFSIIKETVNNSDVIPSFDFVRNLVDTCRLIIIGLVYGTPILILGIILVYILSFIGNIFVNLIMAIIIIVLFFFSITISYIAEARLAKYDKLKDALTIRGIFNDISKIGWGNYIVWLIAFLAIVGILSLIYVLIFSLGIIGLTLASFFIFTYLQMFVARNIGLLYRSVEF